jgi:hypothetical protein
MSSDLVTFGSRDGSQDGGKIVRRGRDNGGRF